METVNKIAAGVVIMMVILLLALVPYLMGHKDGYQAGQIDALNGKIHYRLEKQENSEFMWIECPDVCEYEKGE